MMHTKSPNKSVQYRLNNNTQNLYTYDDNVNFSFQIIMLTKIQH